MTASSWSVRCQPLASRAPYRIRCLPASIGSRRSKRSPSSPAAIGRDFPYQLLAEIAPLTRQQLQAALDRLTGAGLIYRLPGQTADHLLLQARLGP